MDVEFDVWWTLKKKNLLFSSVVVDEWDPVEVWDDQIIS